ncbi:hypothetical protein K0M31_018692 [Melipona bicolor]|uniref:Uncharacterized protein n=1 Tax=Melipona bicolor TaxID=60889 RepID=A0AA40G3U2_9HYME|nr:hypothetical protein K0M31_018692 [Melipona bicolor]
MRKEIDVAKKLAEKKKPPECRPGLYVGVRVAIEFNKAGFRHQDKSSVISKASQQSKGKDLASNPRKQPS